MTVRDDVSPTLKNLLVPMMGCRCKGCSDTELRKPSLRDAFVILFGRHCSRLLSRLNSWNFTAMTKQTKPGTPVLSLTATLLE